MDPTKILEADHRAAEALIAQIKGAKGNKRAALITKLNDALLAHMKLEEAVLYPSLEGVTGKEPVIEAETEHDLTRTALKGVVSLSPGQPGLGAAIAALEAGLAHHVKEEDNEVFPKMRKGGPRVLDKIATPFMSTRVSLGLETTPAALASAFNKAELMAEATSAGVSGTATMKKAELAVALGKKLAAPKK